MRILISAALVLTALGSTAIAAPQYVPLSDASLAARAELRPKITAIAACALPEGVTAVAETEEGRHEFPGLFGLAPQWAEGATLSESEQRWISACMLARFGAREPEVLLSLSANGRAAPVTSQLSSAAGDGFTLHEGGFFGNLFADDPVAYACAGDRTTEEDADPVMELRTCTGQARDKALAVLGLTDCGFRFIGFCSQLSTPEVSGIRYDEVIEVYLEPTPQ